MARAIELLRLIAEEEANGGLSVSTGAGQLRVDKSTASRLLSTLSAGGLIVLNEQTHRYHMGAMAFVLGSHFWGASIGQTLRPILRVLSEGVHCTAQVGTLQEAHVLYLAVIEGSARLRVVAAPGDRGYAHASAIGKVTLAGLPYAEREAVLASLVGPNGQLPAQGPGTIRDVDLFRRELEKIARVGYSLSIEESTAGVSAVAVAVHQVPGVSLGVSVTFPAAQYAHDGGRSRVLEHLRDAAAQIEARFSGGDPFRRESGEFP